MTTPTAADIEAIRADSLKRDNPPAGLGEQYGEYLAGLDRHLAAKVPILFRALDAATAERDALKVERNALLARERKLEKALHPFAFPQVWQEYITEGEADAEIEIPCLRSDVRVARKLLP